MSEPTDYKYDVFISYSHRDADWVRKRLVPRLEGAGVKLIYDRRFEPAVACAINMEQAVLDSRCTLAVLTQDWVDSEWTEYEALLATTADPAGRRRRLLPVYLKHCKPPARIAYLTYVDFTEPDEYEEEMTRLLECLTRGSDPPSRPVRSAPVRRLFEVLVEMLQEEEVRRAMTAFPIHFETACQQIELLGDYKDLHDLLHHLQERCYEPIAEEAERFPDDEEGRENLQVHERRLQGFLEDLGELARERSFLKEEASDIRDDLAAVAEILHQALTTLDAERLGYAKKELDRVLALWPPRIDVQMTAAARALNLTGLAASMKTVCGRLRELSLRPEQIEQFETGVAALERLAETLTALVGHHKRWQRVDQELRQIAGDLSRSLETLKNSWPRLKRQIEPLHADSNEKWALTLREDEENLESRLAAQDPVKIRHLFKLYRGQADRRFIRVDGNLKKQCDELREASEPLATVLGVFG